MHFWQGQGHISGRDSDTFQRSSMCLFWLCFSGCVLKALKLMLVLKRSNKQTVRSLSISPGVPSPGVPSPGVSRNFLPVVNGALIL